MERMAATSVRRDRATQGEAESHRDRDAVGWRRRQIERRARICSCARIHRVKLRPSVVPARAGRRACGRSTTKAPMPRWPAAGSVGEPTTKPPSRHGDEIHDELDVRAARAPARWYLDGLERHGLGQCVGDEGVAAHRGRQQALFKAPRRDQYGESPDNAHGDGGGELRREGIADLFDRKRSASADTPAPP